MSGKSRTGQACYWNNDQIVYLAGGTDTSGIHVTANDDVYVSGEPQCFWENGKGYTISFTTTGIYVNE